MRLLSWLGGLRSTQITPCFPPIILPLISIYVNIHLRIPRPPLDEVRLDVLERKLPSEIIDDEFRVEAAPACVGISTYKAARRKSVDADMAFLYHDKPAPAP